MKHLSVQILGGDRDATKDVRRAVHKAESIGATSLEIVVLGGVLKVRRPLWVPKDLKVTWTSVAER